MAATGISRIDDLLTGIDGDPIRTGDPDKAAVAIIQELLTCQGFVGLPSIFDPSRGIFGPKTTEAVRKFQMSHGLAETGAMDAKTLDALIHTPTIRPLATHGYLALVLDFAFEGMIRLVSLTSQFEGAGSFTAFNANTDGAGASFGLIQWAQKPGRLHELLRAFHDQCPTEFVQIFGTSDSSRAEGLLNHTSQPGGGVDRHGHGTDPTYELTKDPWKARFRVAGLNPELQKVQVRCASDAFTRSYHQLQRYAPNLHSERAVAFMLDLANQHGDGGARNIFEHVSRPGLSEKYLLASLQEESVARVKHQFDEGPEVVSTRNRREAFRTSSLLSDEPFMAT